MSSALSDISFFDKFADAQKAIEFLGLAIHECGMFGCKRPAQGMIIALECMTRRQAPLLFAQTYHLIENQLTMRADAMLARFVDLGNTYEIISRTPELAIIDMTVRGKKTRFSFSWEDATNEPFVYQGKKSEIMEALAAGNKSKLKFRDAYATPRSRMQMLWARVTSDGARASDSRCNHGAYDAWEIDDDAACVIEGTAAPAGATTVVLSPLVDSLEGAKRMAQGAAPAITQQPTLADTPAATASPATEAAQASTAPTIELCTKEQRLELDRLWAACMIPPVAPEGKPSIPAILRANYGVESNAQLTKEQAAKLIANMLKKAVAMKADIAAASAPPPSEKGPKQLERESRPSTEQQHNEIIAAVNAMSQEQGGKARCEKFFAHLKANGINKRQELSYEAASLCLLYLANEAMDGFFQESLEKWSPPESSNAA